MMFCGRRIPAIAVVLFLWVSLVSVIVMAGSTGQIKGRITDSETGEPVIGASVLIVGTTQGAYTDVDGYYTILRVDPGTYSLRITHVDYKTVEVTDVKVQIDLTTEHDQGMEQKVTELDEKITVKGRQDILNKFEVAGQVNISQEEISHRPVQTVDQLLEQVPGVQLKSTGEIFIRGGRAGEVSYIVDGVPMNDPLGGLGVSGGANLDLASGSIADIQIIKDGFDPEYGNALSGIVNIRSQTGSKDNTRVFVQYLTDDLGNRDLNEYSRNYDFLQFQVAGPDPILKTKILPALGLNFLEDKEFTYFLYAEVDKRDTWLNYERYDSYTTRRSYPVFNLFGIDIPERQLNRYTLQANFKFRPHQNLKFVLSLKKWIRKETVFSWGYRYSAATAPIELNNQSSISLEVTQNVSKDMNYEAIISVRDLDVTRKPGDPDHPGRGLDPDDFWLISEIEDYQDLNNNGVYDPPEPIINLFPDTAGYGSGFSGPAYTFGEFDTLQNLQGGSYIVGNYRFNDNGVQDNLEGEPFIDLNGNGVWDQGDYLNDRNGNGRLDYDRRRIIDQRTPEPYIDGDIILGEPFIDVNNNGVYEQGLDVFVIDVDDNINMDKNRNGQYDGPDMLPLNFSKEIAFEDRNGNGVYDMPNSQYDPGEPYSDVNGNGKYDYGGSSTFLDPGQIGTEARWRHSNVRTYRGEVKLTRQFGRHDLRAGFALTRDDLQLEEIERPYLPYTGRADSAAYPDRGAFRDFYDYAPMNGTVYARDKLEYGSMIAMLGLRWDFFLQDVNRLEDLMKWDDRGGTILGDRQKLSPRIGFSYPISDKAKVYFNYGHFFQLPAFARMYARNTSAVNQSDVLGYPNLDYVKTIQYSFGVRYKMSDYYTVDIQGYFKDEFDKIAQQQVREGVANQIRINQFRNADYGRSRGIELTLEKRGGGSVNGQVSYTYAFAYGKASQTNDFFMEDFLLSREPLTEAALDHDIRHSLKAGIQFYLSTTVKPRLFGLPIPNGWSLSIESIIESGAPYTPDKNYPDIDQSGAEDIERNSLRLPGTAVFDFTFRKEFQVVSIDWSFVLWVENLFDTRNVTNVYAGTGRADTDQVRNQVVYGGTEFSNSPTRLDYGRQIRLGLEMSL